MSGGVFDLSKPGARVVASSFGGGWIIPLDAAGLQACAEFFGQQPHTLKPFVGGTGEHTKGYIVEPYQSADLAEHLRACNVAWEIG